MQENGIQAAGLEKGISLEEQGLVEDGHGAGYAQDCGTAAVAVLYAQWLCHNLGNEGRLSRRLAGGMPSSHRP